MVKIIIKSAILRIRTRMVLVQHAAALEKAKKDARV
jgi:hypothetical protein